MQTGFLGLSLAINLVKPLMSLYRTEWSERGYMDSGQREGRRGTTNGGARHDFWSMRRKHHAIGFHSIVSENVGWKGNNM